MQEGTAAEQDQEKIREPAHSAERRGGHLSVQMGRDTN
jgi:hypothetical protein